MIKERLLKNKLSDATIRFAVILLALVAAAAITAAGSIYFADAEGTETPIRVVHKVDVAGKDYCFFVQNNVVLTPADLVKTEKRKDPDTGEEIEVEVPLTNAELTALILERAGFYMKETNCTESSHKVIKTEDWKGGFVLYGNDYDTVIACTGTPPTKGNPLKRHMDLNISTEPITEPVTEETKLYPTRKLTSPELLFVVIATEEDAKTKEDVCPEEKKEETPATTPSVKQKKLPVPKVAAAPKEELPEFKTIKMLNRSGGPLEDTLKDGTPVSLTWIEPGRHTDDEKKSFLDRIPGGFLGLITGLIIFGGMLVALILAIRRRREEN